VAAKAEALASDLIKLLESHQERLGRLEKDVDE
jgi:hypothetical protein